MFEYIDDQQLRNDIEIIMKMPVFKASLFHKVQELMKGKDAGKIQEYQELEKIVDPGKKKEKKEESVKQINFEIKKVKRRWTVYPVDITQEIVNHIISFDLNPGVIKMGKFKLPGGKMIDLSFEMKSPSLYTGSIRDKCSENEKKTKQKTPKPACSKKDKLKTVIAYLVENETFSDWMINEFFEYWKPLIDDGFITSELSER